MKSYTIHISLYDAAFFGLFFIAVTFILLLWFAKKTSQSANRLLAMSLTIASLWMARTIAMDIAPAGLPPVWHYFISCLSLAFGPLIYLYVLKTIRPHYKWQHQDWLHLCPLIVAFADGAFWQKLEIIHTAAFVSILFYLYRCHVAIQGFYHQLKFAGGDRYRHGLRWLHQLLSGFSILLLLWLLVALVNYFFFNNQLSVGAFYPIYLLLMATMIWLAARAFLRQGISPSAHPASALKPMLPADLKQKGTWLKRIVKEQRHFQDPELGLNSLAARLGLSSHELSRVLNTVLKKSFSDFINEYRVQDVVQKMQDPAFDHITLLGIAYESGFNSQSSFNRIFKQITGKSPLEYKNELKKKQSSYNLSSDGQITAVSLSSENTSWRHCLKLNRNFMLKNYFKIARRNLLRNKSYSTINIAGLAVGVAVCLMIFVIIQFQSSFDDFHTRKDRIFRVLTAFHETGTTGKDLPFSLPAGLKTAFPQIEQVAPIYASQNDQLLIVNSNGRTDKIFKEQRGLFYTEPSFFKMFDFPLLAGSYESLNDPTNVLLTKETAEKYFGNWKLAMGKTIKLEAGGYMFSHGTETLKVSGI